MQLHRVETNPVGPRELLSEEQINLSLRLIQFDGRG